MGPSGLFITIGTIGKAAIGTQIAIGDRDYREKCIIVNNLALSTGRYQAIGKNALSGTISFENVLQPSRLYTFETTHAFIWDNYFQIAQIAL